MNEIYGPFTLVAFGAFKLPNVGSFATLDEAKSAVKGLKVPEDARVLIMGNKRTAFGSVRLPVA